MRALVVGSPGGPDVLEPGEVDRPEPLPTEVLVRVHAAGVNPVDWKTRAGRGMAAAGAVGEPPWVLGWDVSGVVEEVGRGVTRFQPGDEVFGMPWFPRLAGAYAEYVAAPSGHFAPKPASLDHVQAAALPLAALTAWQALVDVAHVEAGQRVLVHAAGGGVGHLAVQLAKARGATVVGTASAAKHDAVRDLGADELVDYRETRFEEAAGDIDVVLDTVGGDYSRRSLQVMRPSGVLVALPSPKDFPSDEELAEREVRGAWMLVEPDHHGLEMVAGLVEAGRLRVLVEAVEPLERARSIHERGEEGHTLGKLVLDVAGSG